MLPLIARVRANGRFRAVLLVRVVRKGRGRYVKVAGTTATLGKGAGSYRIRLKPLGGGKRILAKARRKGKVNARVQGRVEAHRRHDAGAPRRRRRSRARSADP